MNDTTLKDRSFIAEEDFVKIIGRTYLDKDDVRWLTHSASGVEFITNGSSVKFTFVGDNSAVKASFGSMARFAIYVDGERVEDIMMDDAEKTVKLDLNEGEKTVSVIKLSECSSSIVGIKSIEVYADSNIKPTAEKELKIEFVGDSITCGYGVDDEDRDHHFSTSTEDATRAYAYKTAQLLNADYSLVSFSGHGIISSYTGDGTINESGLVPNFYDKLGRCYDRSNVLDPETIKWDFESFVPDIIVINLGTNDNSYVKGDAEKANAYKEEYIEFLKDIRKHNPDAQIVCTLGAMGADLYPTIEKVVSEYSAETGDKNVFSFKLGKIRADEEGYAADWHPTEKTHERCANEMAQFLATINSRAKSALEK